MGRQVRLRRLAEADLDAAIAHLRDERGDGLALELIDAVEGAVDRVRRQPHLGSLRFSYELGIPELRAWPIRRFHCVVFYVESDEFVDVWRITHERRDIAAHLRSPDLDDH